MRGLCKRHIPDIVFSKAEINKVTLEVDYNEDEAQIINLQIEEMNQYLRKEFQFEKVKKRKGNIDSVNIDNIPIEYYIELVNQYHKHIECIEDTNDMMSDQIIRKNETIKKTSQEVEIKSKTIAILQASVVSLSNSLDQQGELIYSVYNLHSGDMRIRLKNLINYFKYGFDDLFDFDFYAANNLDLEKAKIKGKFHYLFFGSYEKRDPSATFNTFEYILNHPEIVKTGENALLHYIKRKRSINE